MQSKPMVNKFSKNILKTIIGEERAVAAFQSVSMGEFKNVASFQGSINGNKNSSAGHMMKKAQSLNEIGSFFQNRFESLR